MFVYIWPENYRPDVQIAFVLTRTVPIRKLIIHSPSPQSLFVNTNITLDDLNIRDPLCEKQPYLPFTSLRFLEPMRGHLHFVSYLWVCYSRKSVCYSTNPEPVRCGLLQFDLLRFPIWSERGITLLFPDSENWQQQDASQMEGSNLQFITNVLGSLTVEVKFE